MVANQAFGLMDDEGFADALDDEYLGKLIPERLASYDPAKSIGLDELIIQLGFDPEELREEAGIEHSLENLGSLTAREWMLATMDDGSGSLIPPAVIADSPSPRKENQN